WLQDCCSGSVVYSLNPGYVSWTRASTICRWNKRLAVGFFVYPTTVYTLYHHARRCDDVRNVFCHRARDRKPDGTFPLPGTRRASLRGSDRCPILSCPRDCQRCFSQRGTGDSSAANWSGIRRGTGGSSAGCGGPSVQYAAPGEHPGSE